MDALFTEAEMASSCYKTSGKSTKPPLNKEDELLEGTIIL